MQFDGDIITCTFMATKSFLFTCIDKYLHKEQLFPSHVFLVTSLMSLQYYCIPHSFSCCTPREGEYPTKFYIWRHHTQFQTLAFLYTLLTEKATCSYNFHRKCYPFHVSALEGKQLTESLFYNLGLCNPLEY